MAGIDWTGFARKMQPQGGRTKQTTRGKFEAGGGTYPAGVDPAIYAKVALGHQAQAGSRAYQPGGAAYEAAKPRPGGGYNPSGSNLRLAEMQDRSASGMANAARLGSQANVPTPTFSASPPGFQVPPDYDAIGRSMINRPGLPPMEVAGVNPMLQRRDWLQRLLESMSYRRRQQ